MSVDIDSPEAQARREAYYNRTCRWCGHAMGSHMIFSGCILFINGCSGSPMPEQPVLANGGMKLTCVNCGHEPCAEWCNADNGTGDRNG